MFCFFQKRHSFFHFQKKKKTSTARRPPPPLSRSRARARADTDSPPPLSPPPQLLQNPASEEEPYPFDEREFVRVIPAVVARSSRDPTRGVVVFAQITDADADDPARGVSGVGARGDGATLHDGAAALSMEIGGDGLLALLLMGAKSAAQSARRERRAEARREGRRLAELERRRRRRSEGSRAGFGGFFGASQRLFEDGGGGEEGESSEDLDDSDGGEEERDDDGGDDDESSVVPPLALDLLWKVLSRGRRLSRREWSLVRVAVVDVDGRSGAFVARLFFGGKGLASSSKTSPPRSPSDPVVTWETRARPSEAAWLAHRFDAPLFVRRDIFNSRCSPLGELLKEVDAALDAMGAASSDEEEDDESDGDESDDVDEDDTDEDDDEITEGDYGAGIDSDGNEIEDSLTDSDAEAEIEERVMRRRQRRQRQRQREGKKAAAATSAPVPFSSLTTPLPALAILAPGDPPPVVLLKRQLAVALSEEDYSSASAIRVGCEISFLLCLTFCFFSEPSVGSRQGLDTKRFPCFFPYTHFPSLSLSFFSRSRFAPKNKKNRTTLFSRPTTEPTRPRQRGTRRPPPPPPRTSRGCCVPGRSARRRWQQRRRRTRQRKGERRKKEDAPRRKTKGEEKTRGGGRRPRRGQQRRRPRRRRRRAEDGAEDEAGRAPPTAAAAAAAARAEGGAAPPPRGPPLPRLPLKTKTTTTAPDSESGGGERERERLTEDRRDSREESRDEKRDGAKLK